MAVFDLSTFSEQTGARSLRTSKFIPDVPFHVYYFVQVVWNANDHKSRRSGEENGTSRPPKFEFKVHIPRGFSARRLDYLGNCGVHTNMGVGLLHTYRCHRCTAKNSSFVVIRAFRFVGQRLVFMLASSAAAVLPCASRLDSRPRNKRLRKQYGSCGRPHNNEHGYFLVALPRLPAIWSINLTSYCRLRGSMRHHKLKP